MIISTTMKRRRTSKAPGGFEEVVKLKVIEEHNYSKVEVDKLHQYLSYYSFK